MAHKIKTHVAWSDRETSILRDNYTIKSKDEMLALLPNRDYASIRTRAYLLKVSEKRKSYEWTQTEDTFIKNHYHCDSKRQIMSKLSGRSWGAIRNRASKLDVLKRNFWNDNENSILKCNYSIAPKQRLMKMLSSHSNWDEIQKQASSLGLKRSTHPPE